MRNYSIFASGFYKETVGMKFNTQISMVFIYINNEKLEAKIKKYII